MFDFQTDLENQKFADLSEVENKLVEIEQEFNETVSGNPDTCKIIFEDFRSQIVIDAAQSFLRGMQT